MATMNGKNNRTIIATANAAEREYLASVDRMAVRMIEQLIRDSEATAEKWQKWMIDHPYCAMSLVENKLISREEET